MMVTPPPATPPPATPRPLVIHNQSTTTSHTETTSHATATTIHTTTTTILTTTSDDGHDDVNDQFPDNGFVKLPVGDFGVLTGIAENGVAKASFHLYRISEA